MPFLSALPTVDPQSVVDGAKLWSGPGYIDGLQMQWVSATAVTVSSGRAYIPSLGYYLDAPNAISLTGLALAASTFYHLYLYNNAGTPAVECVMTAPAAPYNGTARAKTGDTSRRYIGSVLTDASGNVYNFIQNGAHISYQTPGDVSPFRALSAGTAVISTSVSLAGVVPVTSALAQLRFLGDPTSAARWSNNNIPGASTDSGAGTYYILPAAPGSATVTDFPLSAGNLFYWNTTTPTGGGVFCDTFGYVYDR